jgi:hypothetical protein
MISRIKFTKFLNGEALNEAIKKQLNPELNFVNFNGYL